MVFSDAAIVVQKRPFLIFIVGEQIKQRVLNRCLWGLPEDEFKRHQNTEVIIGGSDVNTDMHGAVSSMLDEDVVGLLDAEEFNSDRIDNSLSSYQLGGRARTTERGKGDDTVDQNEHEEDDYEDYEANLNYLKEEGVDDFEYYASDDE